MTDHWSNITEPCILRQLRTEEGREMRRKGIEKFKYKAFYPRTDGISGTLTTLLKDNLLLEPIVIGSMQANAYIGPVDGVSPCLTSAMGEGGGHFPMITEFEPVIIQKVGDRGTNNYSVKKIANTIPVNPMSDRGQLLVEPIIKRESNDTRGILFDCRKI